MTKTKRKRRKSSARAEPPPALRLEWRSPSELAENPANWRRHPEQQLGALAGALREVGWAGACLYNETTGRLIDGHARKKLAKDGEKIPVLVGRWTLEQEATILATLDPLAAMATVDATALEALLKSVQVGDEALRAMLADLAAQNPIVAPLPEPGGGGDDFDATPADGPTRTQRGELWVIGGVHRLLVGDCTNEDDVRRVMGGERATLALHDPPYGIAIVRSNGKIGASNLAETNTYPPVTGDDRPFDPAHLLNSGDVVVLWGANNYADKLPPRAGWLVWDKREDMPGNDFSDCELAWTNGAGEGVRRLRHLWSGMIKKGESGKRCHPTQKPVALNLWVIEMLSAAGSLVTDWYFGSGTTLIAAHRLGRRCYGLEIEPRYCDVILKRAEAEGLAVEKVS